MKRRTRQFQESLGVSPVLDGGSGLKLSGILGKLPDDEVSPVLDGGSGLKHRWDYYSPDERPFLPS